MNSAALVGRKYRVISEMLELNPELVEDGHFTVFIREIAERSTEHFPIVFPELAEVITEPTVDDYKKIYDIKAKRSPGTSKISYEEKDHIVSTLVDIYQNVQELREQVEKTERLRKELFSMVTGLNQRVSQVEGRLFKTEEELPKINRTARQALAGNRIPERPEEDY